MIISVISDFRRGVNKLCALLGFYAAQISGMIVSIPAWKSLQHLKIEGHLNNVYIFSSCVT
jgi:hypothetical protein